MGLTFKGMSLAGTAVKLNKRHQLEFFMRRGKRLPACKRRSLEEQICWQFKVQGSMVNVFRSFMNCMSAIPNFEL
jgi:hypothetical protein